MNCPNCQKETLAQYLVYLHHGLKLLIRDLPLSKKCEFTNDFLGQSMVVDTGGAGGAPDLVVLVIIH